MAFTIQNVPIKYHNEDLYGNTEINLQYKMFLLNCNGYLNYLLLKIFTIQNVPIKSTNAEVVDLVDE